MTDNAVYEDKLQVRSARLLEQFCILKQLHHIWCILLEASKETYMFREIHILKTKNPSNIFKYFYEPAVMAEQDGLTGSRLGRLGQLHCLSSSCLREWTRCAGSSGFLGSSRALQWWQRWELQAPSCHRNQAWPNFDACNHGIHHPRTYWKIPWLLVSICRFEVCRCSQWTCSNLQSASSRLGSDRGIHGLLRSFPRPVSWNSQPLLETFGWKLITSDDPEVKKTKLNAELAKRPFGHDGHHRMFFQARCSNWMEVMISVRVLDCHVFYTDEQESTDCMYINAMICIDIRCTGLPLVLHGCFNSRCCRKIMTDNAVYEDKLQVRSARLLEQFCILKQLHHIWCILLEASKETYMFREIHILKTKNPSKHLQILLWTCGHGWTGWIDWQRLGRLGQLHCLSSSCLREWTRCAGSSGFLGSSRALQWWQRWELQAPSCHRNQAWPKFRCLQPWDTSPQNLLENSLASCLHLPVWSLQMFPMDLQQSPKCQQQAGLRSRAYMGLLRSFPRPVSWNRSLCWRLWMEAHHIGWPRGEENQA